MAKSQKKNSVIDSIASLFKKKKAPNEEFTNSKDYWINRYKKGGNSGAGSYKKLAQFKAEVINDFVKKKNIQTVIEMGSGDGNQLEYFEFPSYIGFDISDVIINKCKAKFANDKSKQFLRIDQVSGHSADMVMSLDVIYHLIEDETYQHYMNTVFELSNQYVIIYSIDDNDQSFNLDPHVKPRKFSSWVKTNKPEFQLLKHIPNKYPFKKGKERSTSFADFYIYEKIG